MTNNEELLATLAKVKPVSAQPAPIANEMMVLKTAQCRYPSAIVVEKSITVQRAKPA